MNIPFQQCPFTAASEKAINGTNKSINDMTYGLPVVMPQESKEATIESDAAQPAQAYEISTQTDAATNYTLDEAETFLRQFAEERKQREETYQARLHEVRESIKQTGAYQHSTEELNFGATVAWRNSTRCIGRLYVKTLKVLDMRHANTAQEVFDACVEHLHFATNGGDIRSTITIFRQAEPNGSSIRIFNSQLIRYAGYQQPDSSVIGDPANVAFTKFAQKLGWQGKGTPFDVLPLVIHIPGQPLQFFELPRDVIMEVEMEHPDYSWFRELRLRWHAVPVVSDMRLEIGGISYPAAPFNGWYMGTEIGARNFGDEERYNMLPVIARRMGLDTSANSTLWRDRALVELNVAVLRSFDQANVKMVDHHTASDLFMHHVHQEAKLGRCTYADWAWITPPISGSATKVFHQPFEDATVTPNFFYQICTSPALLGCQKK
ncbi:MAG: nitric oxide synthase oxygenase [Chloroflexota bacterium]